MPHAMHYSDWVEEPQLTRGLFLNMLPNHRNAVSRYKSGYVLHWPGHKRIGFVVTKPSDPSCGTTDRITDINYWVVDQGGHRLLVFRRSSPYVYDVVQVPVDPVAWDEAAPERLFDFCATNNIDVSLHRSLGQMRLLGETAIQSLRTTTDRAEQASEGEAHGGK